MADLLDALPCGYLAFADDGTIESVNRTLAELLGYPSEELVGRSVDFIFSAATRIFFQTHFFPMLSLHGQANEIYISLRDRDQQEVPMLLNASRERHVSSTLNVCAMIPISERKKYEDEILLAKRAAEEAVRNNEELVRTKGELERYASELDLQLSGLERKNQELVHVNQVLSHDLREPIRKISWFTEALREEAGGSLTSEANGWIDKIARASHRADELLRVLQEFVNLDQSPEPFEDVSLEDQIEAAVREARVASAKAHFSLQCSNLPVVRGVRSQLALLFRLLIEHAIALPSRADGLEIDVRGNVVEENRFRRLKGKYSYEPFARVTIRVGKLSGADELTDELFDPLANLRRRDGRVGVGLATCRKIVDNHNGTISVRSTGGAEAVFTVLLPVAERRSTGERA